MKKNGHDRSMLPLINIFMVNYLIVVIYLYISAQSYNLKYYE
jgi:hypothetical protein